MKPIALAAMSFLPFFFLVACHTTYRATDVTADADLVKTNISSWSPGTKRSAEWLTDKYGQPDEMTADILVWKGKAPWDVIVLYRDEIPHDFPDPHTDFLQQTIRYKVPADKYDDLAHFDGSVIAERTRGTLSARCNSEELNFLALNLAHDIITDKATIAEARERFAEIAHKFSKGWPHPYLEKLQFDLKPGTADRDTPTTD